MGPRAGLGMVSKRKIPSPRRESNPDHPIVQPVASRYSDLTIPALTLAGRKSYIYQLPQILVTVLCIESQFLPSYVFHLTVRHYQSQSLLETLQYQSV
jgi:hypothetical protein